MHRMITGMVAVFAVFASAPAEPAAAGVIYVTGSAPTSRGDFITRKTTVELGELDLNKAENAPAILALLKQGTVRVCTPLEGATNSLKPRVEICQKRALAATLEALNTPELSRLAKAQ